ncbi:DUF1772 domain-containing protein [soil metagenome]
MKLANIILAITATLTTLVTGLFFAWSVSITLGLLRVSDSEYVSVTQSTNRAIQNPLFFAAFFGAQIFLIVCLFLFYDQSSRFWFLLAATIFFTIGVMGVTIFGNVPMNNALDSFDLKSATQKEISTQRKNYERRWNNLNNVRTVSSTIAVILVIIACLEAKNNNQ